MIMRWCPDGSGCGSSIGKLLNFTLVETELHTDVVAFRGANAADCSCRSTHSRQRLSKSRQFIPLPPVLVLVLVAEVARSSSQVFQYNF